MSSSAQIAANRLNAQASSGPMTDEGKAKVSQNAVKFGFNGRHIILPGEDPTAFETLAQSLAAEHKAQTPTERVFTVNMAKALWKQERIERREAEILGGNGFDHPELALLDRYLRSARREFYQAFHGLLALRRNTNQQQLQHLRNENEGLRATCRALSGGLERAMMGDPVHPIFQKLVDETKPILDNPQPVGDDNSFARDLAEALAGRKQAA